MERKKSSSVLIHNVGNKNNFERCNIEIDQKTTNVFGEGIESDKIPLIYRFFMVNGLWEHLCDPITNSAKECWHVVEKNSVTILFELTL